jgi:hypothetical protein
MDPLSLATRAEWVDEGRTHFSLTIAATTLHLHIGDLVTMDDRSFLKITAISKGELGPIGMWLSEFNLETQTWSLQYLCALYPHGIQHFAVHISLHTLRQLPTACIEAPSTVLARVENGDNIFHPVTWRSIRYFKGDTIERLVQWARDVEHAADACSAALFMGTGFAATGFARLRWITGGATFTKIHGETNRGAAGLSPIRRRVTAYLVSRRHKMAAAIIRGVSSA